MPPLHSHEDYASSIATAELFVVSLKGCVDECSGSSSSADPEMNDTGLVWNMKLCISHVLMLSCHM